MAKTAYGIDSVENALHVLTLLAQRSSVRVSDVAAELGIAPSSAHRLLNTLLGQRFAVQDSHRRYHPGPAFAALQGGRPSPETIRRLLRPHLVDLVAERNETAHLIVLAGVEVRFLDCVEANRALNVSSRAGRSMPAHLTSGGKALLATLPDEELAARYGQGYDGRPIAGGLRGLFQSIAETRRCGYGINIEESEPGIIAVGACVRASTGDAIAAISVSVPAVRLPRAEIGNLAQLVVTAALRASATF